jgi:hypothetical protein
MELVIDFDKIEDPTKQQWLINSLKLMHIEFHTAERRQTIEEYNEELELAVAEIKAGNFTTHEDLKAEVKKW